MVKTRAPDQESRGSSPTQCQGIFHFPLFNLNALEFTRRGCKAVGPRGPDMISSDCSRPSLATTKVVNPKG